MRERRMRISAVAFFATVATTLAAFVLPGAATSAPPGCANRTNTTYQQLLDLRDARRRPRAPGGVPGASPTPTTIRPIPGRVPPARRGTQESVDVRRRACSRTAGLQRHARRVPVPVRRSRRCSGS